LDDLSTACAAILASWSVYANTALVPLNLNLVGLLLAIYLDRLPTDDEVHWVRFEADLCLLAMVDGEHIMPQVVQALSTAKRHHARAAFGSLVRASFSHERNEAHTADIDDGGGGKAQELADEVTTRWTVENHRRRFPATCEWIEHAHAAQGAASDERLLAATKYVLKEAAAAPLGCFAADVTDHGRAPAPRRFLVVARSTADALENAAARYFVVLTDDGDATGTPPKREAFLDRAAALHEEFVGPKVKLFFADAAGHPLNADDSKPPTPLESLATVQLRATNNRTRERARFTVHTWDPDAVSALPVARRRFQA
jgi:hypothetical protein